MTKRGSGFEESERTERPRPRRVRVRARDRARVLARGKDPASTRSVWDVPGLEAYHGEDVYLTEVLAREATQAVRAAAGSGKPFLKDLGHGRWQGGSK